MTERFIPPHFRPLPEGKGETAAYTQTLHLQASPSSTHFSHQSEKIAIPPFKPAWWCRNPHLQTLWPVFFRRHLRPSLRRERLEIPDGDFVDLDWTLNSTGPIVVLFHGLEGGRRSHYARAMLDVLPRHGYRVVLMHFRGCSGEPNRLPCAYHSGDTGDIDFLIRTLKQREPRTPVAAIGYSLGGNALLKWLGEQGAQAPVCCAVAVSIPFLLQDSSAYLNRGFSKIYQRHLMRSLKAGVRRKAERFPPPVPLNEVDAMQSFFDFDNRITGPVHGFRGAQHYYSASSSRQFLQRIRIPTLIVHSSDDPFMPASVIPQDGELSASITFALQTHGGHVGFVSGNNPLNPHYWLDSTLPQWLKQSISTTVRV